MSEDTNTASRRDVLRRGAAATGALLAGTATVGATVATAATIRVGPDGSIGAAVDEAAPGDTVLVEGGTHREQVLVRKDLILRADDATLAPPSGELETLSGIRPLVGAAGVDVEVTVEGFTVDGEGRDAGDFYTGVGYVGADGRVRDVTVERTDFGGYVTRKPGSDVDHRVAVTGCRFEGLGADPLVFARSGTTGRVLDSTFVGTPGTAQRALTAGYGARVLAEGNAFREFYVADGGTDIGVGFFAFDSADNTLRDNEFEAVQYPAYLLAYAGSDLGSAAGRSRIERNEAEGEDLPDGATSYGTVVSAYDPETEDGTTETANDVRVVNNDYEGFDVGVALLTEGEGTVRNTKVINNGFDEVDEPIVDEGEGTKKRANRVD